MENIVATMSETEKAYLAGIVDGEGAITILSRQYRHKNGKVYPVTFLRLMVTSTSPKLIKWLGAIGGSTALKNVGPTGHLGKKPIFYWATASKLSGDILEQILPYLIIKKEQAEAAIAFQSLRRKGKKSQLEKDLDMMFRDKVNARRQL